MTTYQDPPLQSRRAARQTERADQLLATYPVDETGGPQNSTEAESISYAPLNRPPLPHYDDAALRGRRAAGMPSSAVPEASADGTIDDRVPARPIAPEPVAEVRPLVEPPQPVAHTLTRRELRAMREAQGLGEPSTVAEAPAVAEGSEAAEIPAALSPVAPAPQTSQRLASALAEFDSFAGRPLAEQPAAASKPAAPDSLDSLSAYDALFQPQVVPATSTPSAAALLSAPPTPQAVEAQAPAPVASSAPIAPPGLVPPLASSVAPSAMAEGHWTNQAELDDRTQINETTITRSVGGGSAAITTSALVMPSIPNHEYAKLSTGDILVTGSIALPHSLSTEGAHPTQLDEHDLDHLLDPGDRQVASADSAPVRAIKAVSTHTSTRNVIATARPSRGTRGLTVLIISAATMAAVVATLLVVGLVSGIL